MNVDRPIRKLTEAGRSAANALSAHTLKVARPFFWHVGAKNGGVPKGATAFLLQFKKKLVVVTANHVIDQYLEALAADSRMLCQLGYAQVWPERSIIARDKNLDIATFEIDSTIVPATDGEIIDCRNSWPPPAVEEGDTLTLTGFLDLERTKIGPQHYDMPAWGAHGVADAVSKREIVTIYEPEKVLKASFAIEKPKLGFNMSGCSGGPVLLVKEIKGLLRWFPIGLIYKGADGKAEGELSTFDRIHIRRIHFIQADGTISNPDAPW